MNFQDREIKFRHWFEHTKVMSAGNNPLTFIMTSTGLEDFWKTTVWMQFTGLHDKNGKEIYEGDILCTYGHDYDSETYLQWQESGYEGPEPEKVIVKRDVCTLKKFRLWLEHESFGYEGEDLQDPEDWEIIGNIYQHANLLQQ